MVGRQLVKWVRVDQNCRQVTEVVSKQPLQDFRKVIAIGINSKPTNFFLDKVSRFQNSGLTGPLIDHTTLSPYGHALYAYGKTARSVPYIIQTPTIDLLSPFYCFSFWYHAMGDYSSRGTVLNLPSVVPTRN